MLGPPIREGACVATARVDRRGRRRGSLGVARRYQAIAEACLRTGSCGGGGALRMRATAVSPIATRLRGLRYRFFVVVPVVIYLCALVLIVLADRRRGFYNVADGAFFMAALCVEKTPRLQRGSAGQGGLSLPHGRSTSWPRRRRDPAH